MKTLFLMVAVAVMAGCEALPAAGDECPAGQVVQVDICPGTLGRLATCLAMGEDRPGTQPVQVAWCLAPHTPAEGVTDYAECVPVCP
jgi:hypothetical protein